MEVILQQDVDKIGKAGSVAKVKDGFARNFLFPNKLAVPLNNANLKNLQARKEQKSAELAKAKSEAEALKEKLSGVSITIPVLTGEAEQLYGSISSGDIVAALKEEGFEIDKSLVALESPIKALGIYEVPIKLHPEVTTKVKIWVVKK